MVPKLIFTLLILCSFGFAQSNEDCMECHEDKELVKELDNSSEIPLFVDINVFNNSIHTELECIDCHSSVDLEEHPDEGKVEPVICGDCHDDEQEKFDASIHGIAHKKKQAYAPTCIECHGKHDILAPTNPKSPSYKMNIPLLCGKCHKEGAPVTRVYKIAEHNILENYSLSIHGEGMFKKGLTVTAACADCHDSHLILPHTDPRSTIAPNNIARTCMVCHARIEDVHKQVIEGERWEKAPGTIPSCTDCHLPHKARKESLFLTLSDQSCLKCHQNKNLHKTVNGEQTSLFISKEEKKESVHSEISCVKCHSDVNPRLKRPCATATKVICASCHIKTGEDYRLGGHFKARESGIKEAPECITCHGIHNIKASRFEDSKTYRANVPKLCGKCHSKDKGLKITQELSEKNAYVDYSQTVHGKGLMEKGLLPSAICTDCHTAHTALNHLDPLSSVNKKTLPATCASCHKGIYNQYVKSIHFSNDPKKMQELPSCEDCHSAHHISSVEKDKFITEVTIQCGECHKKLSETYFDTMHGKAYKLGALGSAKCSDCHGSHTILPPSDPKSSISMTNIVHTCQKCHDDANKKFTGYLTHATHHDPDKYPALYYTYIAMTILLLGVFSFFGLHTLLWLPRSIRQLKQRRKEEKAQKTRYYIKRFDAKHRITHLFVIISFLSLALTGMMLKFSGMIWASWLADAIGGVVVAGKIHRLAALTTVGYFVSHLIILMKHKGKTRQNWKEFVFGKDSMMFNIKDIKDFWGTMKWFLHLGPRPSYSRWTYWEKFDYFAVFWGVFIIGISGLMLWFPEVFTLFVPGWLINVATIIHSDEALLATGFIFTIHFFNTHLRPEAFPMDKVIFTGLVPLEEYKKDRPEEYEKLKKTGTLKKVVVKDDVSQNFKRVSTFFGYLFLGIGISLVILIIYSLIFGYK